MAKVIAERMCAEVEGDFAVFLIGARINHLWKFWKWWPVAAAMPRMLKAMRRLMEGRTTFVIAHRLSTVRNADSIHVLEAGRIVEIARQHQLIVYADEIYDKVLYDGVKHTPIASLSQDVLTITFNSLSKSYRSCGYRAGWMFLTGDKRPAKDYIEGLNMLSNMRLCANVPGQWAIQTALGGHQSINELVNEGGRLRKQRDLAYEMLTAIPGVTCVKPKAAMYLFPKLDPKIYPIEDDQQFILDLLLEEKVLLVQGSGFNWGKPDHFRVVFLPHEDVLKEAADHGQGPVPRPEGGKALAEDSGTRGRGHTERRGGEILAIPGPRSDRGRARP